MRDVENRNKNSDSFFCAFHSRFSHRTKTRRHMLMAVVSPVAIGVRCDRRRRAIDTHASETPSAMLGLFRVGVAILAALLLLFEGGDVVVGASNQIAPSLKCYQGLQNATMTTVAGTPPLILSINGTASECPQGSLTCISAFDPSTGLIVRGM